MFYYEVLAQFAKANAPSFYTDGYSEFLDKAKDFFNMNSLTALNPKKITELEIIDKKTLKIVFQSKDKLNISQASRSLRLFSMYLIDETHPLNFRNLISGKRLFKMSTSEILPNANTKPALKVSVNTKNYDLKTVKYLIELLEDSGKSTRAKEYAALIKSTLEEYRQEEK